MKVNNNLNNYSDEENVDFAQGEYGSFNVGDPYIIGPENHEYVADYVQERYGFDEKGNNDTSHEGMQAYVVTPHANQASKDVKQVAVVYQANNPGNADGNADWFDNDLKVGVATEVNHNSAIGAITYAAGSKFGEKDEVTPQLKESAKTLDKVCKKYPNAEVYVYGQS